jgi:hypothetical protein
VDRRIGGAELCSSTRSVICMKAVEQSCSESTGLTGVDHDYESLDKTGV